jgi:cysteine desulfurase
MRRVNLDHQAGTPVLPTVLEAMLPWFSQNFGVPSSLHQQGLLAREAVGKAREQVAALVAAESAEDIIFTSDGTESANLAVKGAAYANQKRGNHLVISATEQAAVLLAAEFLAGQGFQVTLVPVNAEGIIDPAAVQAAVTEQTILIAVHHVNHELGAIQPVEAIGKFAAERGITFYVDAEASAGWLPIDVRALGAGLLSFSAHKFYGPKGAGVLYRHRRARLTSLLHGSAQEGGRRAGAENVPAIVGAGAAAELAARELPARMDHTARLQRYLLAGLREQIPHLKLNGPEPGPRRISTTLSLCPQFIEGEGLLLAADMQGIALASGSSCVSKSLKIPHVLRAIGLDPALAQGNILLSLGAENTEAEMNHAIETLARIVTRLRSLSPTWEDFQRAQAATTVVR